MAVDACEGGGRLGSILVLSGEHTAACVLPSLSGKAGRDVGTDSPHSLLAAFSVPSVSAVQGPGLPHPSGG